MLIIVFNVKKTQENYTKFSKKIYWLLIHYLQANLNYIVNSCKILYLFFASAILFDGGSKTSALSPKKGIKAT